MKRGRGPSSVRLQPRDRNLLLRLLGQRVLTRDQILKLGIFKTSVGRVNVRLLQLRRAGLIRRVPSPLGLYGSAAIYALTGTGRKELFSMLAPDQVERLNAAPSRLTTAALAHSLRITDVWVAFLEAELDGAVQIAWWLPEVLARHTFSDASSRTNLMRSVKPDAVVRFADQSGRVRQLFIEVDCGNVSLGRMADRFRNYAWYATTDGYRSVYGEIELELAVITSGSRRLQHLRTLAEAMHGLSVHFGLLGDLSRGLTAPVWILDRRTALGPLVPGGAQ